MAKNSPRRPLKRNSLVPSFDNNSLLSSRQFSRSTENLKLNVLPDGATKPIPVEYPHTYWVGSIKDVEKCQSGMDVTEVSQYEPLTSSLVKGID